MNLGPRIPLRGCTYEPLARTGAVANASETSDSALIRSGWARRRASAPDIHGKFVPLAHPSAAVAFSISTRFAASGLTFPAFAGSRSRNFY